MSTVIGMTSVFRHLAEFTKKLYSRLFQNQKWLQCELRYYQKLRPYQLQPQSAIIFQCPLIRATSYYSRSIFNTVTDVSLCTCTVQSASARGLLTFNAMLTRMGSQLAIPAFEQANCDCTCLCTTAFQLSSLRPPIGTCKMYSFVPLKFEIIFIS